MWVLLMMLHIALPKGGVLMLTRQTALDYSKENIRVNSICPGFIETPELIHYLSQTENPKMERQKVVDYHPIGRIGTTEEGANVAIFLLQTNHPL